MAFSRAIVSNFQQCLRCSDLQKQKAIEDQKSLQDDWLARKLAGRRKAGGELTSLVCFATNVEC